MPSIKELFQEIQQKKVDQERERRFAMEQEARRIANKEKALGNEILKWQNSLGIKDLLKEVNRDFLNKRGSLFTSDIDTHTRTIYPYQTYEDRGDAVEDTCASISSGVQWTNTREVGHSKYNISSGANKFLISIQLYAHENMPPDISISTAAAEENRDTQAQLHWSSFGSYYNVGSNHSRADQQRLLKVGMAQVLSRLAEDNMLPE